jgi:LCP family protein required for cell wall assembly
VPDDDDRLGGTRDPQDHGRRHRRGEVPPPPEDQPRGRRRRSVESGGVSVADLVQRHTGSRPDLTPVNPDQLRQNGVATSGRRARHDDQSLPPGRQVPEPPGPSIAAALDGSNGFPPDRGAPRPAPAPAPDNGFPRDEKRPGGASSYFTIPSDAIRESVAGEDQNGYPDPGGFPVEEPQARRPRPAPRPGPETSGFAPEHGPNGFPPDRGAHQAPDPQHGFPPDPEAPRPGSRNGARRPGEASAHYPVPGDRNGFPPDGGAPPRRNGSRRGRGQADGFPADQEAPRHNGHPAGEYPAFPQDGEAPPRPPRRVGEASAHHPAPGDLSNAFGPSGRRGTPADDPRRRPGEASAHFAAPGEAPEVSGRRRPVGDGSGPRGRAPFGDDSRSPGETSGLRRRGGDPRAVGEGSGPRAPFGDDPRAVGEGSGPRNRRGDAPFGDDPRSVGEGSGPRSRHGEAPFNDGPRAPGEGPRGRHGDAPFGDDPRAPGEGPRGRHGEAPFNEDPRAVGEGSGPRGRRGMPGEGRRPGEASTHFAAPGEDPQQGPRGRAGGRRRPAEATFGPGEEPRRPGEASTHLPFPQEGGRPEGASRRRAARTATPQPDLGPDRFPADLPPQPPGQASGGRFPVDDFRRQGPPEDEDLSEPRLTPAAIDAPDSKPRRSSGVPPVPPPPPPMGDDDLVTMTTEMEAIGDEVQKRRTIDHTLARFSAVHDEIKAEEREKKAKRRKLRPWERDDEMDRLDELDAQQSMAMAIPNLDPKDVAEEEKKAKKKRRWRKGKIAGKAFAIFFAGMVFLSTAVAWGFKSYIEASAQQVDALDPDSGSIKDAAAQLGDENFLLVGSDTRAGATAEDGVGDDQSVQGARSDTVMIAHVPKNRERVVVVSFPRDLEVTRPACEGWDPKTGNYTGEQHSEETRVKLNTAYMVGGPKCVTKLVQNLSGLAINHFVGIDFHGFKDMVDAVQGVEVCVEKPMKDDILGVVIPEAGKSVKLTGDQALNFVRARHVEGDKTSDYGRIIRQQRFLSSLLRKSMSSEVLLSPGKLTKFVDAFSKATFGDNIGIDQLFTLGQSMQGVEAGRVTFITVPTVGIENKRHNEDLRADDANALFAAIRQDVPLPGEAPKKDDASQKKTQVQAGLKQDPPPGQPTGPVDPKTVKIQVLNGGNETGGIAGDTADELTELGFEVVQVNASPPVDKTIIRYSKSRLAQAQTLQAAVPGATLVEDASVAGAILLIIGPDFDGNVVSPTGGGAPPPEVPENLSTVNASDVSCA